MAQDSKFEKFENFSQPNYCRWEFFLKKKRNFQKLGKSGKYDRERIYKSHFS